MIAQADAVLPDLYEDLDLVNAPIESGGYGLWWIAGVLALLALAVPLYLAFRRRRGDTGAQAAPPPDPAIEARRRLDALRSGMSGMTRREVAIELAGLLRDYICDRFDIRAPYQTTTEFVRSVGIADHFPRTRTEAVVDLLRTTDLVKFATGILEAETVGRWIEYVTEFVETTTAQAEQARQAGDTAASGDAATATDAPAGSPVRREVGT